MLRGIDVMAQAGHSTCVIEGPEVHFVVLEPCPSGLHRDVEPDQHRDVPAVGEKRIGLEPVELQPLERREELATSSRPDRGIR